MVNHYGYPKEIEKPNIKLEQESALSRARLIPWIVAIICLIIFFCAVCVNKAHASEIETWKVTAYCSCIKCCGKSDGITASGKHAKYGYVALNWLPFGTKVNIEGLGVFSVQDRGARSLFGSRNNHIKHIDVYMPTHRQARQFGVKYLEVTINES